MATQKTNQNLHAENGVHNTVKHFEQGIRNDYASLEFKTIEPSSFLKDNTKKEKSIFVENVTTQGRTNDLIAEIEHIFGLATSILKNKFEGTSLSLRFVEGRKMEGF